MSISLVSQALAQISVDERRAGESQCFVGHDFGQKDLRAKLERALNQLGLKPYFADKEVTGEFILTKVCKKILITRASIVDLTRANPNVYFELGLAVGLNKPVFLVLKSGESVPSLLESFVKVRFTNYVALEREVVAEVPGWLRDSIEHHIVLNNHCHFLNMLCPDRQRVTPLRRFLVLDEEECADEGGRPAYTADQDLRAEVQAVMDRFQFEPAFMDEVAAGTSFRLCDYCRALRGSNFVLCHMNRRTSNNVYLLLGLLTGLGIPSLLMIKEEREAKGGRCWEVPSMLRGLDAFCYRHAVDIGERLGEEVQGFLDRHAGAPLLDKILFFPEDCRALPEEVFGREHFAASGLLVLDAATDEARLRGQNYLTVEHLLSALAVREGELFDGTMGHVGANPDAVLALIAERVRAVPPREAEQVATSPAARGLFASAMERARSEGRKLIEAVDLFLAHAQEQAGLLAELLADLNLAPGQLAEAAALAARELGVAKKPRVDLGTYKDRFDPSGQRVLEHAALETRRRDQNYIAVEHMLDALAEEEAELFDMTISDLSVDPRAVRLLLEKRLEDSPRHVGKMLRIGPNTLELFKRSIERARAQGRKTIAATDLFIALTYDEEGPFVKILVNLGVEPDTLVEKVRARVRAREHIPPLSTSKLDSYKDKFTESGGRILQHAAEWCRRDRSNITVDHLFNSLATEESELFAAAMRELSLDPYSVKRAFEARTVAAKKHDTANDRFAPDTIEIFKKAIERARANGRKIIAPPDLLWAASRDENAFLEVLKSFGAAPELVAERVTAFVRAHEARAEERVKERTQMAVAMARALRKGASVLVVYKEQSAGEALRWMLEEEGLKADIVTGTAPAILRLARSSYSLVITEHDPKGIDGMTILRHAKEQQPNIQVILVPSLLTTQLAVEAGRAGVFNVLHSTFEMAELLTNIDAALSLR